MTRDQEPGIDSARGQGFGRERQDENNQPQNDQAAQFARMMALVEAQSRQIGQLISMVTAPGASAVQSPIVAPAVELDVPKPPPASTMTVAELWARYARTLPEHETWVKNLGYCMKAAIAHFGALPAMELTPMAWSEFRDRIRKAKVCAKTRNQELVRLKAMLNLGVREAGLPVNLLAHVKPEREGPARETEIDDAGLERLLKNSCELIRVFVLVAIGSGMRRGEIVGLSWDEIDFETKQVSLSRARTKSRRARVARLTDRAVAALLDWKKTNNSKWVFPSPQTGKPYTPTRIWQRFREAADVSDLPSAPWDGRVHIHDTRGSYASKLSRLGVQLPVIQKLLDHRDVRTSLRYIRTKGEELDAAQALLNEPRRGPKRAAARPGLADETPIGTPVCAGNS